MSKKIISLLILSISIVMFSSFVNSLADEVNEMDLYRQLKTESASREDERRTKSLTYKVKEGDNLYRISLNHQIDLDDLYKWNGLNSDLIHPGDVLIIDEEGVNKEKPVVQSKKVQAKSKKVQVTAPSSGKEMTVTATAYTAYCKGCSGTTAYGINLRANPNQKVIAVDPRVIPLGTKVWVEGYGVAIAGDTGGAIKGNKIDVFIPSYEDAMNWGVKKIKIKILD